MLNKEILSPGDIAIVKISSKVKELTRKGVDFDSAR